MPFGDDILDGEKNPSFLHQWKQFFFKKITQFIFLNLLIEYLSVRLFSAIG